MTDPLVVLLDDAIAGTLSRSATGRLHFEYHSGYLRLNNATPLSVSMRVQVRSHPDSVVTPWLWGLLPDNEAVLRRWAREFTASASSPFSMLRTPIGHDCPGAVRFAAPDQVETLLKSKGRVTWLSEEDVARRVRELKEDSTAWLGRSFTGQFSLAGAQAKTALLYQGGRWGVPSGRLATTHILKPAVAGLDDHDLNEHLCLDAAHRAGLIVARTRVATFGKESAIVVERYDRHESSGRLRRVHQEDLCQALGIRPSMKYQSDGGPGPRDIVELFRRVMSSKAADDAIERFVDALIWNWLIVGTDAHAKNYSLLLAGEEVRMAPLYDVASALPYSAHERKLRFAMRLGRDYRVSPVRNPWRKVAVELGIDAEATVERARELASRMPDAFAEAAASRAVAKLKRPLPGRLVDLVAARSIRCLGVLG